MSCARLDAALTSPLKNYPFALPVVDALNKALKAIRDFAAGREDIPLFGDLTSFEKLLAFIFTMALIGAPAFPSLIVQVLSRAKCVIPAFILTAIAAAMFKSALRKKSRLLTFIPALLFYIPAFAYLWLIFILVSTGSVAVVGVIIAWCALIFTAAKLDTSGRYLLAHIAGCAILFYSVLAHAPGMSRYIFAFIFIVYLVFCELLRRRKSLLAYFSPVAVLCLTATTLVYCFAYLRYDAIYPDQAARISNNQSVRLIYSYDPKSPTAGRVGHKHMFAARFENDILIGPNNGRDDLTLIPDKPALKRPDVRNLYIGSRGGDMAAYLPDEPGALLAGGVGKLYKVLHEPFKIAEKISAQSKVINFIRVDPVNGYVFASQDNAQNVIRFALDNLADVAYSKALGPWEWFFNVAVDPARKKFYFAPLSFGGSWIVEGDVETLAYTRRAPLKDALCFMTEIDAENRVLFASSYLTGELIVCDLRDLSIKARIPLGTSIRDLTFDPKRRRLYAVNYFAGKVFVLDTDSLAVINSIYVGPIARRANLSRDGNELIIRTAAGIFAIDPDKIENRQGDPDMDIPMIAPFAGPIVYHSARLFLPIFIAINNWTVDKNET